MESDEQDSAVGESVASSSYTLDPSVTDYPFENGRRYHAYQAGKYYFPNDEKELKRMDIEHRNQRLQMDEKLHLCPLDNPLEILDLGCGTGIWCIDMADKYPAAMVLGIDLSPVQSEWVPQNCKFEVDDFELEWTFGESRYNMIHAQNLTGSITSHIEFYQKAYLTLKPGGWFELVEMELELFSDDGTVPEDSSSKLWAKLMLEAFTKIGKPILQVEEYEPLLQQTGFVNTQSQLMKRPTNKEWPQDPKTKEIGGWSCASFLEGLEGFTLKPLTKALEWSSEEVQVLCAKVRTEMLDPKIHGWHKGIVVYAQKPLTEG